MAHAFTSEFNLLALTQPEWKGAALQYREIINFLNRSNINYAISADPVVSRLYLEQFWETTDQDCTVNPNVIRATVAGRDIAISEDTIRCVLQFKDLSTDPVSYPDYFVDGCLRQRMGYVGTMDYSSFKKMWVLDQWRYFAYVMIMCLSARKAGKDAMGHDLAAATVALSLNKGYNFLKYIYKSITDQINATDRFRFLLYPRFVQLLINDVIPNLPAIGERLQVKRVDKRVFAQFLKPGSVEPTPEHTPLFGHLINEPYVAPADLKWYSAESEPELSQHSDEQQEEEEVGSEDDMSEDEGDEEQVVGGAEDSDSEVIELDSSDSDDAPSQAHRRRLIKVTLPESSSKRKRQATSSEYEPDSDSDAAIQRRRRESINKQWGDRRQQAILHDLEFSAQRQAHVTTVSTDSTFTSPSQQLYRRQHRRPWVTPDVVITAIIEEVPVIVSLPLPSVQVAVTTPILTESVTITPSTTIATTIQSTIPTTTIEPISQPYNFGDFSQGFDYDTIFSSPLHNAEASTSSDARINTLETQVAGLLETVQKSREESEAQQAQINSLVDEVTILRS
ncbi:hypothetical protein L1987_48523 [Smallanthus sonchifolius]|uniref:Uncharacterized protein n=1 Tax=Smallanthus sonchifolius TaxID=185202 RepID=A0ACB9FSU4_9ASTR|nr:hypothetical protein L1987_48523 [Smallanthus sonchifolius]